MFFYFDKFSLGLTYIFSILVFFNFSSCFLFWFWLEFNMLIFLVYVYLDSDSIQMVNLGSQCFYYFLIQSTASLIFLFIVTKEFFFFDNIFLILLSFFKLGLYPFHFWIFKITEYLTLKALFLILNFQKIPILILLYSINSEFLMVFFFFNVIFSCFFLFKSNTLIEFMVSSSICFFNWFYFIFMWSLTGLILFLLKYFFFSFSFFKMKNFSSNYDSSIFFKLKIVFLSLFLFGFPPFLFFFFKYYLLNFLFMNSNFLIISSLWVFSFICLISYFNFFFFTFYSYKNLYFNINLNSSNITVYFICFVLSILLLF